MSLVNKKSFQELRVVVLLSYMRVVVLLGYMRVVKVEVEGDDRVAIKWMRDGESGAWKYHHTMAQIRWLLVHKDVVFN